MGHRTPSTHTEYKAVTVIGIKGGVVFTSYFFVKQKSDKTVCGLVMVIIFVKRNAEVFVFTVDSIHH